jgi:hypothetical protein
MLEIMNAHASAANLYGARRDLIVDKREPCARRIDQSAHEVLLRRAEIHKRHHVQREFIDSVSCDEEPRATRRRPTCNLQDEIYS